MFHVLSVEADDSQGLTEAWSIHFRLSQVRLWSLGCSCLVSNRVLFDQRKDVFHSYEKQGLGKQFLIERVWNCRSNWDFLSLFREDALLVNLVKLLFLSDDFVLSQELKEFGFRYFVFALRI